MPKKISKIKAKQDFNHRGRIQAQGKSLEASETWAKNTPPTKNEGLVLTEKLRKKMPRGEARIREGVFEKLKRFILQAARNGGISASVSKTFDVKGTKHERVDLEVAKGIAFIEDKNEEK